jgi:hypothetical protein
VLAGALGADEVRIVGDGTAAAGQVLAGDPAADPAQVAALLAAGYRSQLTLPIGANGRMLVYSRGDRPWARFQIARARTVTSQLERLV